LHALTGRQEEADRLEEQNSMFDIVFDGRLFFPPVEEPKRVLDCGYGSGSWAVVVAEEYPECDVRLVTSSSLAVTDP